MGHEGYGSWEKMQEAQEKESQSIIKKTVEVELSDKEIDSPEPIEIVINVKHSDGIVPYTIKLPKEKVSKEEKKEFKIQDDMENPIA